MQRYALLGVLIPIAIIVIALLGLISVIDFSQPLGLSKGSIFTIARFSLWQATLSTLLSTLIGVPLALYLYRQNHYFARALERLCDLVMIAPVLVVILSLAVVYGNNGWLKSIIHSDIELFYGLSGILLAHTFINAPLIARFIQADLYTLPSEYGRIARQYDFSGRNRFKLLYLPVVKRSLYQCIPLVFTLCFTSFAIVLIMGANPIETTFEVAIYQALKYDFAIGNALWLTLIQLGVLIIIANIWSRVFRYENETHTIKGQYTKALQSLASERQFDSLFGIFAALFFVPVAFALVSRGINDNSIAVLQSLAFYEALRTSVIISVLSASISVVCGFFIVIGVPLYKPLNVGVISLIALLLPSLLLAMGIFVVLRNMGSLEFSGFVAICFITSLKTLPFVITLIYPHARTILKRYQKLYAQIGFTASNYIRLVVAPLMRRHLSYALVLSGVLSLGDFSTIALFGSENLRTLPYLIYQYYGSYQSDKAYALSLILFLIIAVFFTWSRRNNHDY